MASRAGRKKQGVPFLHRHHFYWLFIAFCGYIFFPPAAVLARFGIGKDFFINLLLYICGYIPAVIHNFFCQNIRDNSNRGRSPKWAVKHGLVKDPEVKRSRQRQWAHRYNERAPINPYDDPSYNETDADGHTAPAPGRRSTSSSYSHPDSSRPSPRAANFYGDQEEAFYNPHEASFGPRPGEGESQHRGGGGGRKSRSKRSGSRGGSEYEDAYGSSRGGDQHAYGHNTDTRRKERVIDTNTLHHDF